MVATTLNDKVMEWGVANGYDHYNQAKDALIAGRTPEEIITAANATNWNEALYSLADIPAVLREATLWLDAAYSVADEQTVVNQGTGGSALNAQYGSTAGADTNDPLFLPHTGENYVYTPDDHTAQTLMVPDAANLELDAPMTFKLEFTATRTDLALQRFGFAKSNAGPLRCYDMYMSNATFRYSTDGTNFISLSPGGGLNVRTFTKGQRYSIEWSVDPTTGAWSYTEDDVLIDSGTVAPWTNTTSTEPLYFFGRNNSNSQGAKWHRFRVTKSGTTVLDVDCANDITSAGATSFTATSGQTVTVNRSATGRKTTLVTRPIWLFGTDDYLEVADNALLDFGASDSFTVMGVVRSWATFGTGDILLAKKADVTDTTAGYSLGAGATAAQQAFDVGDGTAGAQSVSGSRTSGSLYGIFGVRNTTADTITTYLSNTAGTPVTDATTATSANSEVLRVGRLSGAGAEYLDGEVIAVAVWPRVLTTDEIAAINTFYGTA